MEEERLLHSMAVNYYSSGRVEYGNYIPANHAEGSIKHMDKMEMFKLLSLIVYEMQKDKEIAQKLQEAKEEKRQRDENSLKWHRYVENEALIESGKMSSSSVHTSRHNNLEDEYKQKTKLWTPQGEVSLNNKLMGELN